MSTSSINLEIAQIGKLIVIHQKLVEDSLPKNNPITKNIPDTQDHGNTSHISIANGPDQVNEKKMHYGEDHLLFVNNQTKQKELLENRNAETMHEGQYIVKFFENQKELNQLLKKKNMEFRTKIETLWDIVKSENQSNVKDVTVEFGWEKRKVLDQLRNLLKVSNKELDKTASSINKQEKALKKGAPGRLLAAFRMTAGWEFVAKVATACKNTISSILSWFGTKWQHHKEDKNERTAVKSILSSIGSRSAGEVVESQSKALQELHTISRKILEIEDKITQLKAAHNKELKTFNLGEVSDIEKDKKKIVKETITRLGGTAEYNKYLSQPDGSNAMDAKFKASEKRIIAFYTVHRNEILKKHSNQLETLALTKGDFEIMKTKIKGKIVNNDSMEPSTSRNREENNQTPGRQEQSKNPSMCTNPDEVEMTSRPTTLQSPHHSTTFIERFDNATQGRSEPAASGTLDSDKPNMKNKF